MFSKIRKATFYPAVYLDSVVSHSVRHIIIFAEKILALALLFVAITPLIFGFNQMNVQKIIGALLLSVALGLIFVLFEAYYRSIRNDISTAKFMAGKIIYLARGGDIVSAFLKSGVGINLTERLEIKMEDIKQFLSARTAVFSEEKIANFETDDFNIKNLVIAFYDFDDEFKKFFAGKSIDKNALSGALDWAIFEAEEDFAEERWWTRPSLSKIQGVAKDWSYGGVFNLMKYSRDLADDPEMREKRFDVTERVSEVKLIEQALLKSKEANVVIVGDPGAGIMDVIYDFERRILDGKVHPALEHKRIFALNFDMLISFTKEKTAFEFEFMKILNEAVRAGNAILFVENIGGFISSASSIGSNVGTILSKYMDTALQIIATTDAGKYHTAIETNVDLSRRFEKIVVSETDEKETLKIIEAMLREIEPASGVRFSYPAILQIVRGGAQYFPDKVMPDGAIDLLFEILGAPHGKMISKNDVLEHIEGKTKIPLGEMTSGEKDKLLNLEMELHKRVIGQEEAISAISSAIRRSRADISNTKKPVGSFLFLGPTGVGKTETAKALAQVFFGDEKRMLRLDMTEYQKSDSLGRLIGGFESGKPGVLSSLLRENPYGVLLLDEFEKAEKDVLNLFLQILDEGFFSDMNGKRVSARNLIIIATSNAASQNIFEIVRRGENLEQKKDEIIQKIIADGIYKPELLNRFDATILFHPLGGKELKQVAGLMLKKLASRLTDKGIELVVNDMLMEKVARLGSNETFGARPMNRFIQERVEEVIAKKMISGELFGGSKFEFKESDF